MLEPASCPIRHMFRSRITLAALLFLATLAVPATAASITGKVVDAATRLPLGSMVVEVWDPAGMRAGVAQTDSAGLYTISIASGSYRLLAYDPAGVYATAFDGGADAFETTPVVAVGAATHRADFALVRGGRAVGGVSDPHDRPLAGLVVAAYNPSGTRRGFTKTHDDGSWSLLLPAGTYRIAVYDEAGTWATMFHRNVRAFADATPVTINASATTAPIDLRVDRAARLSGRVTDPDGLAVADAAVYGYTPEGALVATTKTDAGGAYRLAVPDGAYRLVAADPRRILATSYYPAGRSFERAPVVAVAAGEVRTGVDFVLVRAATIVGTIRSGGGPLAGIEVGAFNADGSLHLSARTAADGAYALTVAPGEVRIAAWDPAIRWVSRFHPAARDFASASALHPGPAMTLPGIDIALVEGGRVRGLVRDAITKAPVPGIAVAAYDAAGLPAGEGKSGTDGRYGFAALPGETRFVAFDRLMRYAPAYPFQSSSYEGASVVPVVPGSEAAIDFELRRGTIVTGSVVDPWGTPLGGIDVFALDDAGRRVAGATTLDGGFAMVLVPGRYYFVAIDPLRRFAARYYPAASSFEAGAAVDIANGPNASIALAFESSSGRRRAARH